MDIRFYGLAHDLHGFSAAAGDHLTLLNVQDLMADRTVDVAFFFGLHDETAQAAFGFVFHKCGSQ